jgi:hypothetical protein
MSKPDALADQFLDAFKDAVFGADAKASALQRLVKDHPFVGRELIWPVMSFLRATNLKNIERNQRIEAVEKRIDHLEARPTLKDAGVWRHGSVYGVGDVATFKGSAWVCTIGHTAEGPVADHAFWRLLVKGSR